MKRLLIFLFFASCAHAAATPTLIQWVSLPNDGASGANGWVFSLPNTTQSGDAVTVVCTSNDSPTSLVTVTDDKSDTYTREKSQTNSGGISINMFLSANVAAGARVITVTISTGGNNNECMAAEWAGIVTTSNAAAFDVSCGANTTSGTTLTCGSMTTTGGSGDLVLECGYIVSWSTVPSANMLWAAQTGASWNLLNTDGTSMFGCQYEYQSTSGAINPAITASSGAATISNASQAGIALKAANAGGSVPTTLYVKGFMAENMPQQVNLGTTSVAIQFPCSGNFLAAGWQEGQDTAAVRISSIADTNSNTWTSLTRLDSANSDAQIQWWYVNTATCSNSEKLTVTTSSGMSNPLYLLFDVVNAAGLDTGFGTSGVANATATVAGGVTSGTFGTAAGTPSLANEVILGQMNLGNNTTTATNHGFFMAPCINTTSTLGCNQAVVSEGTGVVQDAGISLFYDTTTSSVTTTYTVTASTASNINEWWESIIAVKPVVASTNKGRAIIF